MNQSSITNLSERRVTTESINVHNVTIDRKIN